MKMRATLAVENGETLQALQRFLRRLLEAGVVEALLLPLRTPGGHVMPVLVTDGALLTQADPLAPVMPLNSATLAGKLSARTPRARVGVVMRPCEIRALLELVKLRQASLDDLLLVAVDCAGTVDIKSEAAGWQDLYRSAAGDAQTSDKTLRPACRICTHPTFDGADVSVELLSSDWQREIHITLAQDLAETLGLEPAVATEEREPVIEKLVARRATERAAALAATQRRLDGEASQDLERTNGAQPGLAQIFDACIRCHNCMTVCPICYCKTCVFKSEVFDHDPQKYVTWARQKGALRLPSDTLLFHLTRLNHMVLSCIGCGMCTQACPADLPVGDVFQAIGERVQQTFDYVPGRDVEEPLPLTTFSENEWQEVGES